MSNPQRYTGRCFCGEIELEVTGQPEAMGFCHCRACRHWSASPVNAFTLWKPDHFRVTRGAAHIVRFNKNDNSYRASCQSCGGHLFNEHPRWGLVDVYAAILPELEFAPQLHVNYESTVLRIKDGLPKLKDFPAELGGSGATLPE
jgi:hypothetical protein